jgi:hypothetical protein
VIISLLSREPMATRTEAEERAFLYRWWPQALGLAGGASGAARRSDDRASSSV